MFKRLLFFGLLICLSFWLFAQNVELKDYVVFTYGDCVVTDSDIRAFSYILNLDLDANRQELLRVVGEIEKRYYCLKENYPFEEDFVREYPFLYYQLNLFYGNRLLPSEDFERYDIDFRLLNKNLFRLLFVIKYSFLLRNEEDNDCMKLPVFFAE